MAIESGAGVVVFTLSPEYPNRFLDLITVELAFGGFDGEVDAGGEAELGENVG